MGHHSCCNQQKVKRGLWSPEEDEKLIRYITTHGYGCWSEVPEKAGISFLFYLLSKNNSLTSLISLMMYGVALDLFFCLFMIDVQFFLAWLSGLQRCGKSCRLRWINYLRPDIRRGRFTPEEEKLIISLHGVVGNRFEPHFIADTIANSLSSILIYDQSIFPCLLLHFLSNLYLIYMSFFFLLNSHNMVIATNPINFSS